MGLPNGLRKFVSAKGLDEIGVKDLVIHLLDREESLINQRDDWQVGFVGHVAEGVHCDLTGLLLAIGDGPKRDFPDFRQVTAARETREAG